MSKPKVLILIVAYEAETTIADVLRRIPAELAEDYGLECLVLDDASSDRTSERAREVEGLAFPVTVLRNPLNQGYGGNQKIGYHYAIQEGFEVVALLHGDGQYAPERLGMLLEPVCRKEADAVFGSRMLNPGDARKGGMPLYKYAGNKILTAFQNRLLNTSFSEFHSGYRIYSTARLKKIPFDLNTNDFHFDTEIIVQLVTSGARIKELAIPTFYGDEVCRVKGLKYAADVTKCVVKVKLQEKGILYDPKFDCPPLENAQYTLKLGYDSPHRRVLDTIPAGARVLDLGCAGGYVSRLLKERKGCHCTGVDAWPLPDAANCDRFFLFDLNQGLPPVDFREFDYVLLLDVIEHLASPEKFVEQLRTAAGRSPETRIIISTGNVGFFIVRLMLLLGQFNYGKRGILDLTHTRLFTFASARRMFEELGFRVTEEKGIPGPFPLALGDTFLARALVRGNKFFIALSKGLFSYQIYMTLLARPSLQRLLDSARNSPIKVATVSKA